MTTTPLHPNQKSKLRTILRPAVGRCILIGLILLFGSLGKAPAGTDSGEQLYRRGYPNAVSLEWAVSDYDSVHRSDSVAKDYPELNVAEILPAISRTITETPRKEKQKLARLAALKKLVSDGNLPKGSILTFQYADKNRTPYWFQWGKLSDKFALVLISGMDENPPGEEEYNDKAFIFGVVIRSHKRVDQAWKDEMTRIAEKMKRKKEHRE